VVLNQPIGLGRKEPNDDHYRSRLPSLVSANRVVRSRHGRVAGETAFPSRGGRAVLSCPGGCKTGSTCWDGSQRSRTLVRTIAGRVELWVGDAADIQSKRGRKQKTDRQDAQPILKLMLKDDSPRIWCRVGRIVICGNCSGIGTAWWKPARGS
jgi:hypothetical protein